MFKEKIASQVDNAPGFSRKHFSSAWYFNTFSHREEAYFDISQRFGFGFGCLFFNKTDCRARYRLRLANASLGMVLWVKHSSADTAVSFLFG